MQFSVATLEFPEDLDVSFNCGLLNSTFNTTTGNCTTDTDLPAVGDTSHTAMVPECGNSSIEDARSQDMSVNLYNTPPKRSKKVDDTCRIQDTVHQNPPLPVLFYPRNKTFRPILKKRSGRRL